MVELSTFQLNHRSMLPNIKQRKLTQIAKGKSMSDFKQYECTICGFIYNEEEGLPEEGIEPGTRWNDIPEDWMCPDCGLSKAEFEMIEI